MASSDIRERVTLSPDAIEELALRLDNQALGAAMRLIAAQIRGYGEGVSTAHDLSRIAAVNRRQRDLVTRQLEQVFDTSAGTWCFLPIAEAFARQRAVQAQKSKAGRARARKTKGDAAGTDTPPNQAAPTSVAPDTPNASETANGQTQPPAPASPDPAPPVVPSQQVSGAASAPGGKPRKRTDRNGQMALDLGAADADAPAPAAAPQVPSAPSLVTLAYERGVNLLTAAGRSTTAARTCISMLLKDYDTAYVIKAIDQVEQRGGRVAEPFSYMRHLLRDYPRLRDEATVSKPKDDVKRPPRRSTPSGPREIATPETMGISRGMQQRIRESAQVDPGYQFKPMPARRDQATPNK
jgi:uncharacterized protein YdaU (DUF1376 family)